MSKRYKIGLAVLLAVAGIVAAGVYMHGHSVPVLRPSGSIGQKEQQLMLFALALSLIVVIPVFILLFTFAWKYREGNKKAAYRPNFGGSRLAEIIWWAVPGALILILSIVTWQSSHALDPYKPLASSKKPLTIQVVSLNWKWLFIYPEQHIASVNFLQIPEQTPVTFNITSDTVMNSFWIPSLGGQIYAMPGMSTQLHLQANGAGTYAGSSANISGAGFSGMTFTTKSTSQHDFDTWVQQVSHAPQKLDQSAYTALAKPSKNNAIVYYSAPATDLYDTIVLKYMTPQTNQGSNNPAPNTQTMPAMNSMEMQ
ncbi:MAG TPA: ubiquinol oxidase subunit II [Candidatus Saccharimonadales bacterium]|jgi:cytochrome o ubiquinol oxidase subunit 2|nr:ubiquinol oxidase subunit II [Candidatus Saccharimonadales bacterium]